MISDIRQAGFELDDFRVSDEELDHIGRMFARPRSYDRLLQVVQQQSVIWIVGPEGVGKRTLALALAREIRSQQANALIYRIPRSLRWSQLATLMSQQGAELGEGRPEWLSTELYDEILDTLEACPFFESDSAVLSLFGSPSINVWKTEIPQTNSIEERVAGIASKLSGKHNENGIGLTLLLREVAKGFDSSLQLHALCLELAEEVEAASQRFGQEASPGRRDILILPDALGSVQLERADLDQELTFLERLYQRHIVIVTSSDEVYKQAESNTPLGMARQRLMSLTVADYEQKTKLEMLRRHLDWALDDGRITSQQRQWAQRDLLGGAGVPAGAEHIKVEFASRLITWLPIDIYRFVQVNLSKATHPTQVRDLARQDADIDRRIRTWFTDLDDSTRAFILTLTLMASQPSRLIWQTHKDLVKRLRVLDAHLATPPLGLLRRRSAPYVTENGVFDFVNGQVHKAVLKEIAQDYREYVTDAIGFFSELSTRTANGLQPTYVRNEFLVFFGELGKYGLVDIEPILKDWGSHQETGVRASVGASLAYVAADPSNLPDVFALLWNWLETNAGSRDDSAPTRLRWSVAAALWRVVDAQTNDRHRRQALRLLARLAKDPSPYVASSAAYALHKMARFVPLAQMRSILNGLACRKDIETKHLVWTVDEAGSQPAQDGVEPMQLLRDWLQSDNQQSHEIAYSTLLTGTRLPRSERIDLLRAAFADDGEQSSLTAALFQALKNRDDGKDRDSAEAKTLFESIAANANDAHAWRKAALILDDLQKRENDFNRTRPGEQLESHVCSEMREAWLGSQTGSLHGIAVYAIWIGRSIDVAAAASLLANVARNEPRLFLGTLALALGEQAFDRPGSILKQLLSQHPEDFIYVLAQDVQSGSQTPIMPTSLERLNWDNALVGQLSQALWTSLGKDPEAATQVARHWLSDPNGNWSEIATHALFGSANWLAMPLSADLLKTILDRPSLLVWVMRSYTKKQNRINLEACREVLIQLTSPDGGWRGYLVDALVRALLEGHESRIGLKTTLERLLPGNFNELLADVDKGRMHSEWESGSVGGTLNAFWDWLRCLLTGK